MHDVGMRFVERGGRRIVAVALLGDGQRDDLHGRIAQAPQQRFRVFGRDQRLLERADHLQPLALGAAHRQRVEIVLRLERVAHRGRAQARADDAPAHVAGGERGLGVHRLMRALERADAEMHDAGRDRGAVVARARDVWRKPAERPLVQPLHHLPSSSAGSHSDSAGM